MPYDLNLPPMVLLYLKLIEELRDITDGVDSASEFHRSVDAQIEHYFDEIKVCMDEKRNEQREQESVKGQMDI